MSFRVSSPRRLEHTECREHYPKEAARTLHKAFVTRQTSQQRPDRDKQHRGREQGRVIFRGKREEREWLFHSSVPVAGMMQDGRPEQPRRCIWSGTEIHPSSVLVLKDTLSGRARRRQTSPQEEARGAPSAQTSCPRSVDRGSGRIIEGQQDEPTALRTAGDQEISGSAREDEGAECLQEKALISRQKTSNCHCASINANTRSTPGSGCRTFGRMVGRLGGERWHTALHSRSARTAKRSGRGLPV